MKFLDAKQSMIAKELHMDRSTVWWYYDEIQTAGRKQRVRKN